MVVSKNVKMIGKVSNQDFQRYYYGICNRWIF